jgi:hypothetical protein
LVPDGLKVIPKDGRDFYYDDRAAQPSTEVQVLPMGASMFRDHVKWGASDEIRKHGPIVPDIESLRAHPAWIPYARASMQQELGVKWDGTNVIWTNALSHYPRSTSMSNRMAYTFRILDRLENPNTRAAVPVPPETVGGLFKFITITNAADIGRPISEWGK